MGFFKKKEVKVTEDFSELPELPKLPDLPRARETGFPVVSDEELPPIESPAVEEELPELSKREKRTMEISAPLKIAKPFIMPPITPLRMPSFPAVTREKPQLKKAEPVYIRIDKFRLAFSNFNEIYGRISEIEDLFKEIKETKQREEEELGEWEKEIETLKMRVDAINQNLFSKIE